MIVMGIESSCDETAVGIVAKDGDSFQQLSNIVHSQVAAHSKFGGVVPEIAARAHAAYIDEIVAEALATANCKLQDLEAICATTGPGLLGGLVVGATYGSVLAMASQKKFIEVNHLEAHALSVFLEHKVKFPYLCLLVSGGHTLIFIVKGVREYDVLGETLDDAVGEAFDKVSKMMGLGYPGGAIVEKRALNGKCNAFAFPRPMTNRIGCDFSFSGLKTSVRNQLQKESDLSHQLIDDICASFQSAVVDVLTNRIYQAIKQFKYKCDNLENTPTLVLCGGVACNIAIRSQLAELAKQNTMKIVVPSLKLCTDNGLMIALSGAMLLDAGVCDGGDVSIKPSWPLQTLRL